MRLKPGLVTMDLGMPGLSGLEATRQIVELIPDTHVLVISAHDELDYVVRAIRAGALGYVLKRARADELIDAVETVAAGKRYADMTIDAKALEAALMNAPVQVTLQSLTPQERKLLELTVSGVSSEDAARILQLSRSTVDTYRSRLMGRLGVSNRASLIRFSIENVLKNQKQQTLELVGRDAEI